MRIAHASKDEHGALKNGLAGDQTGQEVYIREWYNRPWNYILRAKEPRVRERIAYAMEHACWNDVIGYDQNQRNTLLTEARKVGYDTSKVTKACETDCSALVSLACMYAGVPEEKLYLSGNSSTTSNLRSRLMSTGMFETLVGVVLTTPGMLLRGDILLYEGHHVAVALDDGGEKMGKKVIDVSTYQGKIDWKKVKNDGVSGAIFKIIKKDLSVDDQFENNWKGCIDNHIPIVGVYNYSYATTVGKARKDAKRVLEVLNGRKATVWLDVEDACMKGLGNLLIRIVEAYQEVIEAAGLEFGVYTGLSFYNNYFKPFAGTLSDVGFWIARYPSQTAMRPINNPPATYQPAIDRILVGWQYSSKCQVNGIQGNVDISDWYYDVAIVSQADAKPVNPYSIPTRLLYRKPIMMKGDDVKWLQWHLVRLGFLPALDGKGKSSIDGYFGDDTDRAVRSAQTIFKIEIDGKVGTVTRSYLEKM